tara:strand:- start:831 stop:1061 length:231 start_codon:yes stop_codon:yes gene_type:complete
MFIRNLPKELQQKIYMYSLPTYPFLDEFKHWVILFNDEGFREENEVEEHDTLVGLIHFSWEYYNPLLEYHNEYFLY